jgi:chromosome partitioning protein
VQERIEITEGKLKAAFVVCRNIKGTLLSREITTQLLTFGLSVFIHGTFQRQEYAKSVQEGRTVCEGNTEATKEIVAIVNELEDFYHGIN